MFSRASPAPHDIQCPRTRHRQNRHAPGRCPGPAPAHRVNSNDLAHSDHGQGVGRVWSGWRISACPHRAGGSGHADAAGSRGRPAHPCSWRPSLQVAARRHRCRARLRERCSRLLVLGRLGQDLGPGHGQGTAHHPGARQPCRRCRFRAQRQTPRLRRARPGHQDLGSRHRQVAGDPARAYGAGRRHRLFTGWQDARLCQLGPHHSPLGRGKRPGDQGVQGAHLAGRQHRVQRRRRHARFRAASTAPFASGT